MPDEESGSGHRKRLREKFLRAGEKAFLDYEILELLLSYAIPRRDVKPLAKDLIAKYHTLNGVLDAPSAELASISGVGDHSAGLISLVRALMVRYLEQDIRSRDFLTTSDKYCDYARVRLGNRTAEVMMLFYLDARNRLIDIEELSEGTTDSVLIFPTLIAKRVLARNAKAVVLCHNHPSGSTHPSKNDDEVTRSVRKILDPLRVLLLDHIIVSAYDYYSYRFADEKLPPAFKYLGDINSELYQ